MKDMAARLLRLLSLLQDGQEHPGADLADSLGVAPRTVRRDIERLRDLGYPVDAARGTAGYRLAAGAALPPLLLDDDEAVAIAVALRSTTGSAITGIHDTALRALAKLEQVLPARLRYRVSALQSVSVHHPATEGAVSPEILMTLADACRRRERLRFDYLPTRGETTRRDTEPHHLVSLGSHWYLIAWDTDRDAWRTFRVDRLTPRTPTGPRFTPRPLPDGDDPATYLDHQLSARRFPYQATVTLHEPAATIADRVWPGLGAIEAIDTHSCLLHVGADSIDDLLWMITSVNADFTLTNAPTELVDALRIHAERCLQATQ